MTQKLGTNFGTEKWNRKWHKKSAQNTKWYRTVTVVEAPDKLSQRAKYAVKTFAKLD